MLLSIKYILSNDEDQSSRKPQQAFHPGDASLLKTIVVTSEVIVGVKFLLLSMDRFIGNMSRE